MSGAGGRLSPLRLLGKDRRRIYPSPLSYVIPSDRSRFNSGDKRLFTRTHRQHWLQEGVTAEFIDAFKPYE